MKTTSQYHAEVEVDEYGNTRPVYISVVQVDGVIMGVFHKDEPCGLISRISTAEHRVVGAEVVKMEVPYVKNWPEKKHSVECQVFSHGTCNCY